MQEVGIAGPGLYVMNEGGRWWPGMGLSAADFFAALSVEISAAPGSGGGGAPGSGAPGSGAPGSGGGGGGRSSKPLDAIAAFNMHTYDDVLAADAPVTWM